MTRSTFAIALGVTCMFATATPAHAADAPPAWAYPVNPPDFKLPPDDGVGSFAQVRDLFAPQGIDLTPGSAEELGALLKADRARYAKVIKDAKITLD